MTALHQRHKRLLLMTFRHLDKMLSEVECRAEGKGSSSVLSDRYTELDQEKKQALRSTMSHLRKTMCRILEDKGILIETPSHDIIHSIDTSLIFMDVSTEEIRPKYMRGYGELSREAESELNEIADEIQALIKQMQIALNNDGHLPGDPGPMRHRR